MHTQRPALWRVLTTSPKSPLEAWLAWSAWWFCKMKAGTFGVYQPTKLTSWTKKSPELEYIYPTFPPTPPFICPTVLYTPTASWSRHHVTCTQQCLSFQNTPHNLHNYVLSLLGCFRCMQLYHDANVSDVDSFSTHSDGTKGQQHRKREG